MHANNQNEPTAQAPNLKPLDRLMCKREVCAVTGLTKSSLQRRIVSGDFPKPVKLPSGFSTIPRWPESVVIAWIEKLKTETYGTAAEPVAA